MSATDSEVIAHLISYCLAEAVESNAASDVPVSTHDLLLTAVMETLAQLQGTYGLVVLFRDYPDVMIAARLGSPLVIGIGQGEHYVASDASPLAGYADKIVYLADHQVAVITAESLRVTHREQGPDPAARRTAGDRQQPSRTRRLSALHAEGDLRTARGVGERDARPAE